MVAHPTNPLMEPVFRMNVHHQLVIIGNGFDRACGLESSFGSFFLPRVNTISEAESTDLDKWFKDLRAGGITAWDLILRSRKDLADRGYDVCWCDVEAAISEVVEVPAAKGAQRRRPAIPAGQAITVNSILKYFDFSKEFAWQGSPCQFVEKFERLVEHDYNNLSREFERRYAGKQVKSKIVKACDPLINDDMFGADCYNLLDYAQQVCPNRPSETVARYLEKKYARVQRWSAGAIHKALLQELYALEAAFDKYLSEEVASKPEYDAAASGLLREILEFDGDELMDMAAEATVLDFNYTTPAMPDIDFDDEPQLINIHGSLGRGLIFGADGTNCLSDHGAVRFTKTYRILERERLGLNGSIAYAPCSGHVGQKETVTIKVYGHSLAQADYSYFQSVFDIVDLYSGSVKLYFLYREFKETAREELLLSIANLLNAYGASMDNKDHGKNLMHKLLLEGRLILQSIE